MSSVVQSDHDYDIADKNRVSHDFKAKQFGSKYYNVGDMYK